MLASTTTPAASSVLSHSVFDFHQGFFMVAGFSLFAIARASSARPPRQTQRRSRTRSSAARRQVGDDDEAYARASGPRLFR
jgi:hypothetical protein